MNGNPRLGNTATFLAYHWPVIQLGLTPLVSMALVLAVFVLACARWPGANRYDCTRLSLIIALLLWATPNAGQMLFYRPFMGNYVYGAAMQLALLIPYRLYLKRPGQFEQWPYAPILLFAAGLLCGLMNEHTGPAVLLVLLGLGTLAWSGASTHRRWITAGTLGFLIGWLALLLAPGQSIRYGGMGTELGVLERVFSRDLAKSIELAWNWTTLSRPAWLLTLLLCLAPLYRGLRGEIAWHSRSWLGLVCCLLLSVMIGITVLGSPVTKDRLFYAACLPMVVAALVALDMAPRRKFTWFGLSATSLAVIVFSGHQIWHSYALANEEFQERVRLVRLSKAGSTVVVPPYSQSEATRWIRSDDLRARSKSHISAMVNHFGVAEIRLADEVPEVEVKNNQVTQ
jgi:hypothetical protein